MNPNEVICPHCKAGIGQPCQVPGTNTALRLSPAHPSRCELVGQRPAYGVVEHYRDLHKPPTDANTSQDA